MVLACIYIVEKLKHRVLSVIHSMKGKLPMTKLEYVQHRRNIKDNGLNYVLSHCSKADSYTLVKLDILANMVDLLAWRVQWLSYPDTSKKNIIKLTSFIL